MATGTRETEHRTRETEHRTRETEHRTGEPPGTDDPVSPGRRSPAPAAAGSRSGGRDPGSLPRAPRRSAGTAATTGGAR